MREGCGISPLIVAVFDDVSDDVSVDEFGDLVGVSAAESDAVGNEDSIVLFVDRRGIPGVTVP